MDARQQTYGEAMTTVRTVNLLKRELWCVGKTVIPLGGGPSDSKRSFKPTHSQKKSVESFYEKPNVLLGIKPKTLRLLHSSKYLVQASLLTRRATTQCLNQHVFRAFLPMVLSAERY